MKERKERKKERKKAKENKNETRKKEIAAFSSIGSPETVDNLIALLLEPFHAFPQ